MADKALTLLFLRKVPDSEVVVGFGSVFAKIVQKIVVDDVELVSIELDRSALAEQQLVGKPGVCACILPASPSIWLECSRAEQPRVFFAPDYDGDGVSSWWEWGIDGMLYAADFAFGGPTGESLVAKAALTGMTKEVGKVTSKTATKELNKKEGIHQRYR